MACPQCFRLTGAGSLEFFDYRVSPVGVGTGQEKKTTFVSRFMIRGSQSKGWVQT